MMKIPYITEVGTILAAIGAASLGVYHGIDTAPAWINGVGLFCGSLGGALIGMRVSKKLTDKPKE